MDVKEAYQEKADAQLREWQHWIARFRADPSLPRQSRWANPARVISRLDSCYHLAQVRLEVLRATRSEAWEEAKESVEQAMIDLKRALDESGACRAAVTLKLQEYKPDFEPFERKS